MMLDLKNVKNMSSRLICSKREELSEVSCPGYGGCVPGVGGSFIHQNNDEVIGAKCDRNKLNTSQGIVQRQDTIRVAACYRRRVRYHRC